MGDRFDETRPLTILDGLVLIAASACTFAVARLGPVRHALSDVVRVDLGQVLYASYLRMEFTGPNLFGRLANLSNVFFPLLIIWTLAVLVLRLLSPRPPLRALLGQPGLWACVAPFGAMLLMPASRIYFGLEIPLILVPGAVGLCRLVLAMSRHWRSERSWVDRAGRLVGLGWLAGVLLIGAIEWLL